MTLLPQVLAAAVHAANEAGILMKAKIGADVIKTKFNPKDLLTEVDAECQRVIEKVVSKNFPEHALLGEENVEPGAQASTVALEEALREGSSSGDDGKDWLWIVDPIDGTTNFVHGIPLSAVSIGVAYQGQIVVGEESYIAVDREPYGCDVCRDRGMRRGVLWGGADLLFVVGFFTAYKRCFLLLNDVEVC